MRKQDKHTPSDNRQQKTQNKNLDKAENPKTSGVNFKETKREALESRNTARNESEKFNKPSRRSGQQGGGERDKTV
jgi:hypothetical protein